MPTVPSKTARVAARVPGRAHAQRRALAVAVLGAALSVAFAAPAVAEPTPVEAAAEAPARDLSRYKEQEVSGGGLLVAAYLAMWVLVAAFAGRVVLRQAQSERDLAALEARVERALASRTPGGES